MAQQRPPEWERYGQQGQPQHHENGLASDMKQEARRMEQQIERRYGLSPVYQGYILMAAGTILLLFSVGLFPILKWVMVAASIAMIAVGIYRSDFFTSVSDSVERMRNRR